MCFPSFDWLQQHCRVYTCNPNKSMFSSLDRRGAHVFSCVLTLRCAASHILSCPIRKEKSCITSSIYDLQRLHGSTVYIPRLSSSPSPGYSAIPCVHRASHVREPCPQFFQGSVQRTPVTPCDDRTI